MTLYPVGYGRQMVTLEAMRGIHGPRMHPEFNRRLFAWLEAQDGRIGIGGGWRAMQPAKPGFAPEGKSFHQSQTFRSRLIAYAAVDLVAVNGDRVHRSPTWSEVPKSGSKDAARFGVHCFITGEPWHMQCVEMRGFASWVNAGRPDPRAHYPLPSGGDPAPSPAPKPTPVPPSTPGKEIIVQFTTKELKIGAKGAEVKRLQQIVNDVARYGLKVDGQFGMTTAGAVMDVQRVYGLKVDGIVGPATWGRFVSEWMKAA